MKTIPVVCLAGLIGLVPVVSLADQIDERTVFIEGRCADEPGAGLCTPITGPMAPRNSAGRVDAGYDALFDEAVTHWRFALKAVACAHQLLGYDNALRAFERAQA